MVTRKAYQCGYFDGIEGFKQREVKDGMISVSESVYFYLPLELQKYYQGYAHGKMLRAMIDERQ